MTAHQADDDDVVTVRVRSGLLTKHRNLVVGLVGLLISAGAIVGGTHLLAGSTAARAERNTVDIAAQHDVIGRVAELAAATDKKADQLRRDVDRLDVFVTTMATQQRTQGEAFQKILGWLEAIGPQVGATAPKEK